MTKLEEHWIKKERYTELRQILDLPVMQEALALIEETAKPNTAGDLTLIGSMPAPEAAFHISRVHFTQSGVQSAMTKLRSLAHPPRAPKEVSTEGQEPYDSINKDNYEEYLNPTAA